MKRIGIIGCENSHALHFAKALNLPDPDTGKLKYPDCRVVAVYGPERADAEKVKNEAEVDEVLDSPDQFFGKVDAMMITNRKGSLHLEYALPFAEQGIPLFVDKPLTSDPSEAQTLLDTVRSKGGAITGGSGCKYAWDIEILRKQAKAMREEGTLLSGTMNFAADTQSEYDGFYFYGPHLTEMGLTVFGTDVQSVQAFESAGGVLAVWRYPDFDVSLHYTRNSKISDATLYGKAQNIHRTINIEMIYRLEVERFVTLLRSGEMLHDHDFYLKPVRIMDAIVRSLKSGEAVEL